MKRLTLILFSFLLTLNTGAQTLIDSTLYNKGLRMIESAKTIQEFEAATNYFDALSTTEHNEWLAPLYAALSYILASFNESDSKLKDELCNKAQIYIDSANMRHPEVSESASIQAFLYQARIEASPIERGWSYTKKADAEIKKAETSNPSDPRAYFLYAVNVYYTPVMFGGGAEKALPLFTEAAEKFNSFVPTMPFMPHWGKQQNLNMIAKCKKELK
jgi:hypothetical protein